MKTLAPFVAAMMLGGCIGAESLDSSSTMEQISQQETDENPALEPSIKRALQTIASTPDVNEACIGAVLARDDARVRSLLLQHGANARYLDSIAIDMNGPRGNEGPKILTLYADSDPSSPGSQVVGLVKIFGQWVDWWKYDGIGWSY
jgi:hypothetical protein